MLTQTAAEILSSKKSRQYRYSLRVNIALITIAVLFSLFMIAPLYLLFSAAFYDSQQQFIGLQNFAEYFSNPSLLKSLFNSIWIATVATIITVCLASIYAFALTSTQLRAKGVFKAIAFLPILAPSLLPSLALVYLFGHQGALKSLLGDYSIYGPIGILLSYCFWLFPAILMLMMTSFRNVDQRLIEASQSLGQSLWATHWVVTLPAIRYGLVSACLVSFTYVITDFGIPKVIGGSFNMMALEVYKQIIGQQNMNMGAVISILLLCPALIAFIFDRYQSRKQARYQSFQAKPYIAKSNKRVEWSLTIFCSVISGFILLIILTALVASFIRYWPYDLSFTLQHYQFNTVTGGGWNAYFNSIKMALLSTVFGTALIFLVVLLLERFKTHPFIKNYVQILVLLPLAIPGLVLGISYILFFNHPDNTLSVFYGSMSLLVISTIVHYYTVPHLTLMNTIKNIPIQLDQAAETIGSSKWKVLRKVYLPMSFPALCDVTVYIFVNAMTTVSAVIFLYSPETNLAAVSILHMDDAGDTVSAVAMSVMILLTSAIVKLLHAGLTWKMLRSSQKWCQSESK